MQQMAKMGDPTDKIDFLLRKSSELLADMRRMERENQKNKKRGDALQKEKDANRTELGKTVTLKEKLEKLCRELQRDNNKLKVTSGRSLLNIIWLRPYVLRTCRVADTEPSPCRTRTRPWQTPLSTVMPRGMRNSRRF